MTKVRLTVLKSECRAGLHTEGQTFIVEDLCPPVCHELWNRAYPYVFALLNGAELDCGETRARTFCVDCPDGGRVRLRGEAIDESEVFPQ